MNTELTNPINEKIKAGTATQDDYVALIEQIFSPTPWAIEPICGIFRCNVGMGRSLQESFDNAVKAFSKK